MSKCQRVGCEGIAEFAWQPFGPDSSPIGTFTALGHHYRGFATLKICKECHDAIKINEVSPYYYVMHFAFKGRSYWWNNLKKVFELPPF